MRPYGLFATLWTTARQAPLSMGSSGQEYWSRLPCLSPGDLPDPGIEPVSLMFPAWASGFSTSSATWETLGLCVCVCVCTNIHAHTHTHLFYVNKCFLEDAKLQVIISIFQALGETSRSMSSCCLCCFSGFHSCNYLCLIEGQK